MHLILIQLVVIFFAVYAALRSGSRFRKGTIGLSEVILWLGFWASAVICGLMPNLVQRFGHLLGVGRGADAVFYLGLVGLNYAFFRVYLKVRHAEQELTVLVRRLALKEVEREHKPERAPSSLPNASTPPGSPDQGR